MFLVQMASSEDLNLQPDDRQQEEQEHAGQMKGWTREKEKKLKRNDEKKSSCRNKTWRLNVNIQFLHILATFQNKSTAKSAFIDRLGTM